MNKLKAFVRLDFMTVKPYLTIKNLLIFAAVALYLSMLSGNMSSAIGVGMMLGTLFVSYPFAVGEKSNMDALYVTLSVGRKSVVLGRYIFTLSLNICAVLFALTLASVGRLIAWVAGFESGDGEAFLMVIVLAALFALIQAIQLPLYFKLGYTKAKIVSIIPLAAFVTGFTMFNFIALFNKGVTIIGVQPLSETLNGPLIVLGVVVFLIAIFASYRLSVSFYKKREF